MVEALAMAIGRRKVAPGLIVHSDRGSQYCSEHYQRELARHGPVPSMSRRADCWDNAVAESTFGRLKVELTHHQRYADAEDEGITSTNKIPACGRADGSVISCHELSDR